VPRPIDKTNFKRQEIPQGITDENGKFSIHRYVTNDGAPAGEYKVGIALMQPVDEEGGDQLKRDLNQPLSPRSWKYHPRPCDLLVTLHRTATDLQPTQYEGFLEFSSQRRHDCQLHS